MNKTLWIFFNYFLTFWLFSFKIVDFLGFFGGFGRSLAAKWEIVGEGASVE